MTCSARCSSSWHRSALVWALIGALGCGHGAATSRAPVRQQAPASTAPGAPSASRGVARVPQGPLRVAVLPLDNESGVAVPLKDLLAVIERRMATRLELVAGAPLDEFLSRHRLRYTGGIDAETARAGRDELGLDAFLITTIEAYRASAPPVLSLSMRLVSTGEEPVILWAEHAVRGGEDRPGLLRMGVLGRPEQVRDIVLARLLESLDLYLRGGSERGAGCSAGLFHTPQVRFRSTLLDDSRPHTLAVVPFLNQSARRNAGDLVALEFVRQLSRTGRYRVLEPGVVRDYLLRTRLMLSGGVSLETTRMFLASLGVDVVISGTVFDYLESSGPQGPVLRFSATALDGGTGEVVWHSSSTNRGDDGVFFFGLGRVRTAGDLTCRMVAGVVDRMGRREAGDVPPRSEPGFGPGSRLGRRTGEQDRR